MAEWESYYVIIGTSGAALIGIQFVVMTLIAGRPHRASLEAVDAFSTPTIVLFAGSLTVSAIMSAPWHSPVTASIVLAVCGFAGLLYSATVMQRALRQTDYKPVWQDWMWYVVLPSAAYATLVVQVGFLGSYTPRALSFIAAAALALLLIGIHNAWDSVIHIVMTDDDGT